VLPPVANSSLGGNAPASRSAAASADNRDP
jgi:hypothetical protein